MRLPVAIVLLSAGLLLPHALTAQSTKHAALKGFVFSTDDLEPLPGVHVFIASSMIGTVTDGEGEFRLERVPPGALRLTISMIGYESLILPLFLKPGEERTLDIDLQPQAYEMDAIVVEAKRDRRWQRRFKKFNQLFLGETRNAKQTIILNPEVLTFDIENGRFTASAREPLLIENRALGYRIRFLLRDFLEYKGAIHYLGESFYEVLTPERAAQVAAWETKRQEAYNGSLRHFLRALVQDRMAEEQFHLYEHANPKLPQANRLTAEDLYVHHQTTRTPLQAHALVRGGPDSLTKRLDFEKVVEVIYTGELESAAFLKWQSYKYNYGGADPQQSWLVLKERGALVDRKGTLLDPYSLVLYGYLSFEAVADALPLEYGLATPP